MVLLQDGVIAFLSAVGLTAIVWLAAGAILHTGRPTVPGLLLVLPLRGEVPALEEDVRELRRVRRQLADCGMTEEARALASYLSARTEGVSLTEGTEIHVG